MGTKNLLDHLKYCVAAWSMHHRSESTFSASSSETVESEGNTTTVTRTLDSFVKRSGKKVTAVAKNKIRERTAALVAAAQLPYGFVENNELDKFAQSFIELGGNVPAYDLIISRTTVRREIVIKAACIQESIKNALIESAKYGSVLFVADLWTDNVVSRSYLDVTFFWVEESGFDKRIWSLRHAMYACKFFLNQKQQIISRLLLTEYWLKLILTQYTLHNRQGVQYAGSYKFQMSYHLCLSPSVYFHQHCMGSSN